MYFFYKIRLLLKYVCMDSLCFACIFTNLNMLTEWIWIIKEMEKGNRGKSRDYYTHKKLHTRLLLLTAKTGM